MHVFHIRGLSSILLLALSVIGALVLLLAVPAAFLMVMWNTLVYEGFKGPEIDIYQGFLLWGVVALTLKLILKPEIKLELVKPAKKTAKSKPEALENKETEPADSNSKPLQQEDSVSLDSPQNKS